ncbi:hypothetical protein BST61_g7762 [Cercospora zeina]
MQRTAIHTDVASALEVEPIATTEAGSSELIRSALACANATDCMAFTSCGEFAGLLTTLEPPTYLSASERHIFTLLLQALQPLHLEVKDISGGCGSMYALDIVSEAFRGLPVIKQHRLVNEVLKEEISKWHGVQLKTKAP